MSSWPGGFRDGLTSYGDPAFSLYLRKVFIKAMGFSDAAIDRPIVGVTNTASAFNSCHGNVPQLIEAIRRGVAQAGGIAFDFPVTSLHESFCHPTSMYLRNLMAMDVEELIRAQPMDAVVLIGGCDKTVPALLMGAASANTPAILEVTGPMLTGSHAGERVGACTDCRRFWARFRAGELDAAEIAGITEQLAPTTGTCMVMGTASTMALVAEALGMTLPGAAAIPAVFAERLRHAEASGARAVEIAREGLKPDRILTAAAFGNALRVLVAVGGSTNALIHLAAIAGRLGLELDLERFDALAREVPLLVDLKPTGRHYMQELHAAGGFPRLRAALAPLLDLDQPTVAGRAHRELLADAPDFAQDVVHTLDHPVGPPGSLAVLRGNLAPDGALIKQAAASPDLLRHEGAAVVFEGLDDLARRIDDPDLEVTSSSILVLKGAGPLGAPGMPEAGYLPIPAKLARAGVKDMVRISDARMSGTAFGTIVLHVAPEAAAGGPLGLARTGDRIRLDVSARRLELLVDEATFAARRDEVASQPPPPSRGYARLFHEQILQAPGGCDFAFLRPLVHERIPR